MDEERQIQRELFEEFGREKKQRFPKGLFFKKTRRTITLSSEQVLFVAIAFVIIGVLFFVLGVERGKRINLVSKEDLSTPAQKQEAFPEPKEMTEAVSKQKEQKQQKQDNKVKYIIQVASYVKEADAKKVVEKLTKQGIKSSIYLSGKYHMVYIGEFEGKQEAETRLKKVRKIYPDSYIRKR